MPHIIIEYSADIEKSESAQKLMQTAHDVAMESGQFGEADIKVRTLRFDQALVGGKPDSFLHVTVQLLDGRTDDVKKALTMAMIDGYSRLNLKLGCLSANAQDTIRAVYSKTTLP
ncbi:hypothetical protein GCM10017044_23740 [Kordiimonas sediminis]|uniref:5-carboxymethyl-2-hydroxymuconate isomerase n=1 Tax=Kordiimonas sediminis TaxID=1735581 RepID=A0A919AVP1_9PROT|nr:5-carboxymethyl-2-hydroxymuconate Delta-isomerase [Kordiimonas sediminis]GHF27843.1 hypothetical protein GCM10017044_23740 [Kordiimonas sediminis]